MMACAKRPRQTGPRPRRSPPPGPGLLWRGLVRRWDGWRFEHDARRLLANPALRWGERIGPEVAWQESEPVDAEVQELHAIVRQLDEIKALKFFREDEWLA